MGAHVGLVSFVPESQTQNHKPAAPLLAHTAARNRQGRAITASSRCQLMSADVVLPWEMRMGRRGATAEAMLRKSWTTRSKAWALVIGRKKLRGPGKRRR